MTNHPASRLFGREEELSILERALERAAAGRLEVVLVEGEAGIGKTRLVAEAVERGRALGFSAWTARFEEMERVRSFGPLIDALSWKAKTDDLGQSGSKAATTFDRALDAGSEHLRLVEELIGLIERAALAKRRVLILDDLHWADPSSLYTIRAATKRLTYVPLFIVGTTRPLPRTVELEQLLQLLDREGWRRFTLPPLSDEAVTALTAEALGSAPSVSLTKRLASASGNPLFLVELIDALRKEGELHSDPGPPSLPPDLRLTILRKISFLSDDSIELLRIASILGTSFSASHLAVVTRRPVVELMPLIRECLATGIFHEDAERIRFRHDLIHEALYLDLPATIRKGLHLETARLLLDADAALIQVAEHFLLGAETGDRVAISTLHRAALEASRSPETRIELLRAAKELRLDDDSDFTWLEADLAEALMSGARFDEAIPLARSLLQRAHDDRLRQRLRRLIARALRITGGWNELVDVTQDWLKMDLHPEERALLLAIRAPAAIFARLPFDQVIAELNEALEIGDRTNNDEIRVAALTTRARILHYERHLPEEIEAGRRALEIVENQASPDLTTYHPHLWLGQAYQYNAMFDEAEEVLLEGLRRREVIGTVWDLAGYQAVLGTVYQETGRWDDAVVAASSCLDAPGFSSAHEQAQLILAQVANYRGEVEEAKHRLGAAAAITNRDPLLLAETAIAVVNKDFSAVRDAMDSGKGPETFLDPNALIEATALLIENGEGPLAEAIVTGFENYVAGRSDPLISASALAARAVLDDEPSAYGPALEQLQAMNLWTVHLLQEQAGRCLASHSRMGEAKAHFEQALEAFENLDAQLLIARTRKVMRSFAIRTGARGKRRRPKFGWEALTDAEQRVVVLAAGGFTNPQIAEQLFLSRYTVQTHLKHIFAKLNISSRMELATIASERAAMSTVSLEAAPAPERVEQRRPAPYLRN